MTKILDDQAKHIIKLVGGHSTVAKICACDLAYVYRWTYPLARRGTDGLIPVKFHKPLIAGAKALGIVITPNDFFLPAYGRDYKMGEV